MSSLKQIVIVSLSLEDFLKSNEAEFKSFLFISKSTIFPFIRTSLILSLNIFSSLIMMSRLKMSSLFLNLPLAFSIFITPCLSDYKSVYFLAFPLDFSKGYFFSFLSILEFIISSSSRFKRTSKS